MNLFDMSGKVAVITGSSRGIGRAIAEHMADHGARVVISSRKQAVCDEVAKAINDKAGKQVALCGRRQHLDQGRPEAFGRRNQPRLRHYRHAGLQRRFQSLLRAASRDFRRPVPKDSRQQHRRQSLADIAGRAADDRTQGRLDHHHLLDRRIEGIDGARRLCDFESRRHAARAQFGLRIRPSTISA